jgi:hypothetical protein
VAIKNDAFLCGTPKKTSQARREARARYVARKKKEDPKWAEAQAAYNADWRKNNPQRKKDRDATRQRALLPHIRLRRKKWKSAAYEKRVAALVRDHGGLCDICGGPPDGRWKKLNIDHCHETGAFRGLLCKGCNQGLGLFRDSEARLLSAARYIKNAKRRKK